MVIDPGRIDPAVLAVCARLRRHGFAAVLVGGAVRDLLRGLAPADWDVATSARPEEVIESCRIIRGMLQDSLENFPDLGLDRRVQRRKKDLLASARLILEAVGDPGDPPSLLRAVERGVLDAPDLRGRPPARGEIVTRLIGGACQTVDPETGREIKEEDRLATLFKERRNPFPSHGRGRGKGA